MSLTRPNAGDYQSSLERGKIGGLTERNGQPRILHSRICQIKIVLDFLKEGLVWWYMFLIPALRRLVDR